MEPIETVARIICKAAGKKPDMLEPGSYRPRGYPEFFIDGESANGEMAHFIWREFVTDASAIIAMQASPPTDLKADNAALVEALQAVVDHFDGNRPDKRWTETERICRAALQANADKEEG